MFTSHSCLWLKLDELLLICKGHRPLSPRCIARESLESSCNPVLTCTPFLPVQAHPLDLVPVVDLNEGRVIRIDKYDRAPSLPTEVCFILGWAAVDLRLCTYSQVRAAICNQMLRVLPIMPLPPACNRPLLPYFCPCLASPLSQCFCLATAPYI